MKKSLITLILSGGIVLGAYAQDSRFISQNDFTKAAEQTVNGVVSIKSFATPSQRQTYGQDYYSDPFFDFFFGSPRGRRQQPKQEEPKQQQLGLGSGVIISEDGYIVTNNHVVAEAERLEVTLNDNRNFEATVIGTDPTTDLALLKINAPDLHIIPMGNSENLKVGEWVIAVGNPFGFTSTVTSGIVSAKARNISSSTGMPSTGGIESYIQTDAAVNRGNSGGALVNLDGELVGINTAIYSQTGAYAGCSFAIPTSIVQKVVSDLKEYGAVQRAYLGIRFVEVTPELIQEKGIKNISAGIYVAQVEDRSAALDAGLTEGDVIVEINGYPIRSTAELQETIARQSPGDDVEICFYRNGNKQSTSATLRNNHGDLTLSRPDNSSSLGASFTAVNPDTAQRLGIRSGVEVSEIKQGGRFSEANIRQGFIILSINNQRVTRPEDIETLYKLYTNTNSQMEPVWFISGIYPTGKSAYYAVPLKD